MEIIMNTHVAKYVSLFEKGIRVYTSKLDARKNSYSDVDDSYVGR